MKNIPCNAATLPWQRKFWNKMRICLLLLIVGTLQTFAVVSYSQSTKLTLRFENATIEEVLNHIEKESEFYFTYSHTQINTAKKLP